MLKALLRKQLSELFSFLFRGKNGKVRSGGALVLYALLMAYVLIVLLGVFFMMGHTLCAPLLSMGLGWLYFAIMGTTATALGVIGSVFTTYTGLYDAKDNDLLLSMPIPPAAILFSRMFSIYVLTLIFEAAVMLPAGAAYVVNAGINPAGVIIFLLTLFILPLLALTLCCILGWLIALISSRMRKKNLISVVLSVAFLAAYFYFYSRINTYLQLIIANSEAVGASMRTYLYPLYQMGLGLEGSFVPFLIFTAITAALFAVIYLILSRSFIRLTTRRRGEKKKRYEKREMRVRSADSALLSKEFARYINSPGYMLNSSLGTLFLIAGAVAVVVCRSKIAAFIVDFPEFGDYMTAAPVGAMLLLISMNFITAPSVSLEGKGIWQLQTMPVTPWQALRGKIALHLILTAIPCVICSAAVTASISVDAASVVFIFLLPLLFTLLNGFLGLMINLKMPNLTWTNETMAVKQSGATAVAMFAGWGILIVLGVAYAFLCSVVPQNVLLAALCVIFAAACILCIRWLKTRGGNIFAHL